MSTDLTPEETAAGWTADEWTYIGRRYVGGGGKGSHYVGPAALPSHDVDVWRLKDRSASAQLEADRARKRAAAENGDLGAMSLADVRAMVSRQVTSSARAGTIAAVLSYIERGA